ncbi:hypothetical protein [Streptomyces griseoluteus]|uniref:hypothetical protein n=1 Tax=Streptomyces griseoluteus TaxID=29306 RepID=UPI0034354E3C
MDASTPNRRTAVLLADVLLTMTSSMKSGARRDAGRDGTGNRRRHGQGWSRSDAASASGIAVRVAFVDSAQR